MVSVNLLFSGGSSLSGHSRTASPNRKPSTATWTAGAHPKIAGVARTRAPPTGAATNSAFRTAICRRHWKNFSWTQNAQCTRHSFGWSGSELGNRRMTSFVFSPLRVKPQYPEEILCEIRGLGRAVMETLCVLHSTVNSEYYGNRPPPWCNSCSIAVGSLFSLICGHQRISGIGCDWRRMWKRIWCQPVCNRFFLSLDRRYIPITVLLRVTYCKSCQRLSVRFHFGFTDVKLFCCCGCLDTATLNKFA